MLYSDEFIETIKKDPFYGVRFACQQALNEISPNDREPWTLTELEALEEADVLMEELLAAGLLPVSYFVPSDDERHRRAAEIREALKTVLSELEKVELKLHRERLASKFRAGIGSKFSYEFTESDLKRIQTLLNELRALVSNTQHFEPEHQQRILAPLENLQKELHKKVSDLDRFWGLLGDAGVMLAKIGNDAKPIVDRIREMTSIVWKTQGRAEQIPSNAPPLQITNEQPKDELSEA